MSQKRDMENPGARADEERSARRSGRHGIVAGDDERTEPPDGLTHGFGLS
jgi:hypothetical protein